METKGIHHKLEYLINMAAVIKDAIPVESMIAVTDTEKYLLYIPGEELNLGDIVGMPIPEGDAISLSLKTKKTEMVTVPREVYGIPFKAKASLIKDENGEIIGAFGFGVSLDHQDKLSNMAQQFASTTEQISASTEELSASAQDLAQFMESLMTAQQDMNEQVKKTENILGFINSIASSSRILGLNAGIEAARSGEHGRGFSVVAKEITKLADSSAKSVDEIRELLVQLKEKVDYIAETVSKTAEIAQQQSASTEEISSAINHLATSAEDIEELASII
ncbi:methyl-accepting chemotaxis protein [Calidifontibacillus oryziterrae]|uniref:methyl-accepting chemotaxis protein n=1 Tax=Calidifontibacillus oryziterrae TaxID=1191699 RepID=UPI0002D9AD65|nr:methyl-accepting chemotaxis protein [Calidifontibacillus oryziterrae]